MVDGDRHVSRLEQTHQFGHGECMTSGRYIHIRHFDGRSGLGIVRRPDPFNDLGKALPDLALPYHHHGPAPVLQDLVVPPVPADVALELVRPILGVCFRYGSVAPRTSVPEASVDEDGYPAAGIRYVRTPADLPLDAVPAQAVLPEGLAEDQLGPGVLALVGPHRTGHAFLYRNRPSRLGA